MRIWDISVKKLCRQHLLGEHRELHAIWSIITQGKIGYSHHPETLRWQGKLKALYARHEALVDEMVRRGYHHASDLDRRLATGLRVQRSFIDTLRQQRAIVRAKKCACRI
ncbi:MAG TPA: pyrimidine dimer DNA glycosylase/endonuclease V [Candidatus Omnitrophota bacterium]|nr:pyrimidine dimer DNA glycosylase/endonuclease V [Candidatus Omnitrophota bacterium]HPT06918.1 pyrimidine dimer DNA glycosylase/endonuclease V [Candidatus Omnitrophota bacterium]